MVFASVVIWMVALLFLQLIVSSVPADTTAPFWVLVRAHDLTAAWFGVGVLALSGVLMPLFARCSWDDIALFIERHLVVLCALALVLYGALAFWAYHHYPLAMDEFCPLSESRAFVSGRLCGWVPPPLLDWIVTARFEGEFFGVLRGSGFYTPTYWPGLAILQMPFVALGVPWGCNPVVGALGLWGVHRLALRLSGSREAAAWAWALMLASPVIALNAASFYAMSAHLLFNVFYSLLLLRGDRRGALAAGIVGGFALVLHNPAPHLAFALPWIGALAWKRRRLLGPLLLGYLVFALPLGFGWSAFLDGFDASKYAQIAHSTSASLPFGEMLGRLKTVVELPSLALVLIRLTGLAKTVVWAVPGLLVIAWMGWRDTARAVAGSRGLRLLAASLLSTFALYWLVKFDQGHGWGYRYIHSAWFVLAILGGCFVAGSARQSAIRPFFAALCALSLAVLLPLRAWQAETFIAQHLAQVPAAPATATASITFINTQHGWFSVDMAQNDPFLRNDDCV